MHVGVTDARESQDARASRCSDASIQNETRASNVPFRFAIKISLRFPLISVRPSHRWRLEKYHRWRMDENGWIGSKRPLRLRPYIYIYILAGSRGDPRGCKWWTPDPEQILARKNSPWPWATLSTYYDTSKAVEHFSGSTSGQCELQLHRLSTAPPHLTKPRATNCNPCKHDALRCSLHSWLLVSSACPTPPSFLPSFLARFLRPRAIFDDFPNRDPLSDSASYLGSSVSLSFSSSSFSFFSPPSVSRVIRIGLEESFLDLSRSLLAREKSSRFIESFESTVTVSSLSRRAVVINNPDARVEGRDWMMSRGWCHAACTQAKRMKRAWKNFFCQYLPFNSRVQALVASETVVHRNRRRGQGQGRERERERKRMDVCYAISSNGVCYLRTRRILLFFVRKNHEESLLFIRLSRIITLIITIYLSL